MVGFCCLFLFYWLFVKYTYMLWLLVLVLVLHSCFCVPRSFLLLAYFQILLFSESSFLPSFLTFLISGLWLHCAFIWTSCLFVFFFSFVFHFPLLGWRRQRKDGKREGGKDIVSLLPPFLISLLPSPMLPNYLQNSSQGQTLRRPFSFSSGRFSLSLSHSSFSSFLHSLFIFKFYPRT